MPAPSPRHEEVLNSNDASVVGKVGAMAEDRTSTSSVLRDLYACGWRVMDGEILRRTTVGTVLNGGLWAKW